MDPLKILIVDDEFQNRDILRTRLEQAGYAVSEAVNGDEAIDKATQDDFRLIILDLMMPKKDGWEVLKILRANSKTKEVPVIVLSARTQPIDEMRSWENGTSEFLSKPMDQGDLLAAVRRLTGVEKGS
ncbi:MAG: hypothetical protein A2901_06570 [Elusimicrobia bacterium RIFCSPLOWO2_01_FULL_54_10]|nr:MAG: hypothetical protein A2901_06570 [Elusimicrobia bacterium RIFCSPLOWO2_01_FULL_54_10]